MSALDIPKLIHSYIYTYIHIYIIYIYIIKVATKYPRQTVRTDGIGRGKEVSLS